jgi:glycosyltransferase involved in cell wall biosynthesis
MTASRRVLALIQGSLGTRLTGPEIRGWEMARALDRAHDVTAMARVTTEQVRDGIRVLPMSRARLIVEATRHDVVIGPVLPPYLLLATAHRPLVRIADLYDPVELEFGMLSDWSARRDAAILRASRVMHLRNADLLLCANDAQRQRLERDLAAVTGPHPEVLVAPMGLEKSPPAPVGHPLRERVGAIGSQDPVVLWWGSVWRWLDAHTAIEAISRLAVTRPDVRLVITAGRPPNAETDVVNATEEARELARRVGLLDRHVFFLDEWVPFDRRQDYLADASVGITLHRDTAEASLAARARYMDYLWAALPSVLAAGDEMADRFAAVGAARLVAPGDVAGTAAALDGLLGDPAALAAAGDACRQLADELRWAAVLAPVAEAAGEFVPSARPLREVTGLAASVGRYYGRRLADRAAAPVMAASPARERLAPKEATGS